MKSRILTLIVVSFLTVIAVNAQNNIKSNSVGTWKFEAPYAPEGYTSGKIILGVAEQKNTASMSFTGTEYVLPGEKVVALKDSVLFSIYLEGQDIKVMLKMVSDTNMTGKAVFSEGEVPLALSKVLTPETEVKK
jgi:hypothetical protein